MGPLDRSRKEEKTTERVTVMGAGPSDRSGLNKIGLAKKAAGRWKDKLAERLVKIHMEELGYLCHLANRTGTKRGAFWVSQSNDIFGVFDIVCISPLHTCVFIQVTTPSCLSARKRKIEMTIGRHLSPSMVVRILTPYSFRSCGTVFVQARQYNLSSIGNPNLSWSQSVEDVVFSRAAIDIAMGKKT